LSGLLKQRLGGCQLYSDEVEMVLHEWLQIHEPSFHDGIFKTFASMVHMLQCRDKTVVEKSDNSVE
jgi:hypothetical protein